MKSFLEQFNKQITGVISCFDRILFKGYLSLGWPRAMEGLLFRNDLLIKHFGKFVEEQSERVKQHAEAVAKKRDRPFEYISDRRIRKEDYVRDIARREGITQGLVCVLRALEPCQSFKVVPGEGRPQLVNAARKCLCYYFYYLDREFGLMHVRIQSWFPLVIQVCLNGHEWLARKMDKHGINYIKEDNAFLWIEDCERAQKFADRFEKKNWPRVLGAFARKVNPLLKDLLAGMEYYWVMDQAEYATDVMFESAEALKEPYQEFLQHATLGLGAEDVLTFLGRKMHGSFQGEVLTDTKKKRFPGARVKHRMKENWIKMYDKFGSVLRVETVINNPKEFKVRRRGVQKGEEVTGWFPMAKGVANMPRYREVSLRANERYLESLSVVKGPGDSKEQMREVGRRVRRDHRSYRALNPASTEDAALLAAVMFGSFLLQGFRNRDIRERLYGETTDPLEKRRQSQRVGRLLKLLQVHGLIAKIPRSRRWKVTKNGQAVMRTILIHHHEKYPETHAQAA